MPADEDPAYWMPDAETISNYQQADLILLNGAGYEQWVDSASLPKSKLCNTSVAFAKYYIPLEDALTHSHGPEGMHAKWMVWEGEPLVQTVAKLAELGVDSVTYAPCGNVPTEGDYLGAQRDNLADLAKVYSELP